MSTAENNFNMAVQMVLIEEGPMSNDKVNDVNGGLTKYGISQVQNPDVDVANLTKAGAIQLYRQRYWDANSLDDIPWPVCYVVFDIDVNNGDGVGARFLQQSLGIQADGMIGSITKSVAQSVVNKIELCMRMLAKRGVFYTLLPNWGGDGEGWMFRNATVAYNCCRSPQ